MSNLILASASPRRRQLLALLGVSFTVKPSPVDEKSLVLTGSPGEQVTASALAKAEAAAAADPDSWVLAADTVVYIDGMILGKPASREEGRQMLQRLSGREHQVFTGVCLHRYGLPGPPPVYEETLVRIAALSAEGIEAYLDTGEPMDKAGAYGIQGLGGSLVPRIKGCYFNVMGLPLYRTARLLEQAGFRFGNAAGAMTVNGCE